MYTVLLVDDEEEVIQVIMRKINWEELGFSVIGWAGNGVKALELMEEFQPDVLVTDIKMPYMDGMELAHRVKTEFPATKILLFTGFDEFEYAKEAIHLEVEEYILKPMNSAELKSVFSRLKIKLDQEISEKRSVETLEKYYLESLPLLRADFYSGLIEGRVHEDEISRYLSECQLSFPGPFFSCLVIHTSSSQEAGPIDPQLLAASVREHAKERLGKKWQAKSFAYLGNTVLILQLGDENEVEYRILLPKNEPFSYTQTGKPYWKFTSACFSLSHCQKGAACSLSDQTEGETGIDIQEPRPVSPAVLRRVCSQKEQAEIALSSNPQAAFTRFWTLKESYVKQTGKGISGDLSQLDFSESGHLFHRYEKDFYQMSHPDFSLALCQKKIDTQPTPIAVHAKEILAFAESKYSD